MSRARRRPVRLALALAALVLAATSDERVFGLITDGQIMTRTAFSMAELHELGIAKGHPVNIPRPGGDAVTRYGMGATLARLVPVVLAPPWERAFGIGSSQTLFVLLNIVLILLAAWAAAALARAWGAGEAGAARAVLASAISSPLWAYAASDFSEPLQAAALGGSLALGTWSRNGAGRRAVVAAALAGALAGFAILSKSILIVLLPVVLFVALWGTPREGRLGKGLATVLGWLPMFGLWLAFELVRFGRPLAGYEGEHFNHPVLDGLWRLTVGPNKGLLLYFPLAVLSVLGAVRLWAKDRGAAAAVAGLAGFFLLSTAAWWSWDGAAGWGPRLLVPLVPLLAALAALASVSLPAAAFRMLFGLGVAVNALGVLQPDAPTTWCYMILPPRVLTEAETKSYAPYAYLKYPDGTLRLGQWFDVSGKAELSQIRFSAWLLLRRLTGRDLVKELKTPPWRTDVKGQEVVSSLDRAMPESAVVFLTTPFRWPHLGMSLTRKPDQVDTVLSFMDCLYDQALRAQDMKDGERAVAFGERVYELLPGPQSAVSLAEGYRLANRRKQFSEFVNGLPRELRKSPDFGLVLTLFARDLGDEEKARSNLAGVLRVLPQPEVQRLADLPLAAWPSTLREIQLAMLRYGTRAQ